MSRNHWEKLLEDLRIKTLEIGFMQGEAERHTLSDDQVRVLEYFWNREQQRPRRGLPLSALLFFEIDRHPPGAEAQREAQAFQLVQELVAKDYLDPKAIDLALTADGMRWMLHRHPPMARWWQKQLEKVPPTAQLVVTVVGFAASVFSLIQVWQKGLY